MWPLVASNVSPAGSAGLIAQEMASPPVLVGTIVATAVPFVRLNAAGV